MASATSGRASRAARLLGSVTASALLVTGACALLPGAGPDDRSRTTGHAVASHESVRAEQPEEAIEPIVSQVAAASPEAISIASVGIDARVTPYTEADVAANAGWVDPPAPDVVSWWTGAGIPASDQANSVYLYGHVSRAAAVFNTLRQVQAGAVVTLTTANGDLDYAVSEVLEPIAKVDLPRDERVTAAVPGRLVLIGCFRESDQGTRPTTHNTVVIAHQIDARGLA